MSEVEFENNILAVKAALDRMAERFLEEAGQVLEAQAKRNTRKKSSHTRNGWKHTVNMSEMSVTIGNPIINAVWEEYGTGEYALNGDGRKGGWVYCVDNGNKITRNKDGSMRKNSKHKKEKEFYFTLGKKPRRMLHNAYHTKKSGLIRRANQLAKEELK
ncbi:MAG: HK97 gp10 family phage protein [Oscillospiraceae bacterium]|nr:HK97 gp10 family phage protein [Oscillospiraceae bacterium]